MSTVMLLIAANAGDELFSGINVDAIERS